MSIIKFANFAPSISDYTQNVWQYYYDKWYLYETLNADLYSRKRNFIRQMCNYCIIFNCVQGIMFFPLQLFYLFSYCILL